MATSLQTAAPKAGMEVVYVETYPVGALDLSSAISKMKSTNPDWIYITGYTKDLILARKQMADAE